jgi:D-sedoheptulose 7-phosphate isomerase
MLQECREPQLDARLTPSYERRILIAHIQSSLREAHEALTQLLSNEQTLSDIEHAAALLIATFEKRGRVYSCGNGGSMCDAMHFAEELTGRYRHDRPALGAAAISDAGHLTCVGNDMGYVEVFSRYVEAHGREGDCLVALSTSGTSKNIIRAAEVAKSLGMSVIVLSGKPSEELEYVSDVYICTPGGRYADRVQELHIKVLHILIELVEQHLFPQNYPPAEIA